MILKLIATAFLVAACAGPSASNTPSAEDFAWCQVHIDDVYHQFMIDQFGPDVVYAEADTPMRRQLVLYYTDEKHLAADLPDTTPAAANYVCTETRHAATSSSS